MSSYHPNPRHDREVRTANPLELSTRVIDGGSAEEPTNRVSNQFTEIAPGLGVVESFSHMWALQTDDGLACWDASGKASGPAVMEGLRSWTSEPISTLVYTHGHLDHVGGSGAVAADAAARGHAKPRVIGHENVPVRLDRYNDTNGYNVSINARQFGGVSKPAGMNLDNNAQRFVPEDVIRPDTLYSDSMDVEVGGVAMTMHHDKGETDDHTWTWIPSRKTLLVGDLVLWVFPNAGNPQKVQRYPLEWAAAMRKMVALEPELLLPAHGLPIEGTDRISLVLGDIATVLEDLTHRTIEMMNAGETLDTIIHEVTVPAEELAKPWLQPVYDEPEFVVHNVWRLYGGWWDGNPARLKPSPDAVVAAEMAALVGGVDTLVARAKQLGEQGDFRLACHLMETAVLAEPTNRAAHGARAELYQARRNEEASLMSKGVFAAVARESREIAEGDE